MLVFVLPHQFIRGICKQLKGKVHPDAHAISMIKGVEVKDGKISIFADVIQEALGISCSALSGANIANEVAQDKFSETTIGHRADDKGGRMQSCSSSSSILRLSKWALLRMWRVSVSVVRSRML